MLAVLGVGMGAVAHLTAQAMKQPVSAEELPFQANPILSNTTLISANPYGNASPSLVAPGLAHPAYVKSGANQAEVMQNLAGKLANVETQQQQANLAWLGNAADTRTLVLPSQTYSQIVTDVSGVQHATLQRKYYTPSVSAILGNGVVAGTQSGTANWARPN